ncbi:MAG: hypothetical protein ABR568_14065 [Pyrinomonadaceae bacterium]
MNRTTQLAPEGAAEGSQGQAALRAAPWVTPITRPALKGRIKRH